jgi:hypothetical protein
MEDQFTFRIEQTFSVAGRGTFVATRLVSGGVDFTLSAAAILAGCGIEPWLDMPRKVGSDGQQELDYFVFKLREPADRHKLRPGQLVSLEP